MKVRELPEYARKEYEKIKTLLTDTDYQKIDEPTLVAYLLQVDILYSCQNAMDKFFKNTPPCGENPIRMKEYKALASQMSDATKNINILGSLLLFSPKARSVAKIEKTKEINLKDL
jgi:phage terminase small subunit